MMDDDVADRGGDYDDDGGGDVDVTEVAENVELFFCLKVKLRAVPVIRVTLNSSRLLH